MKLNATPPTKLGPASDITVEILADSITDGGCRLITWLCTYNRTEHSELLTHRVFSRNSASSRAIPAKKLRELVLAAPAMPMHWGQNQKGMQATEEIADPEVGEDWWRDALATIALYHKRGEELGVHKQIVNRLLEPWMPITIVLSATDHANWFHLRNHKDAHPTMQTLAKLMWEAFHNHMPQYIAPGGWHLPFIRPDDIEGADSTEELLKISVGRCARTSYLTHNGIRDKSEDIALHDKLAATASGGIDPMHASPFEHQARALGHGSLPPFRIGNFEGWQQYRKMFEYEAGPDTRDRCGRCGCWGGRHVVSCAHVGI